ncbi:Ribonuclease H2 subunit B [Dermatophagoides farinae]|uniref:Ribonuclease H2 subunit B n=1 Tax=Dermatophagoides farinae TaxID=6954 RepID=A0A922L906_DERFA|nr:Ribonuclease H2 subunit B [Dermatophagoides farinae]
MDIMADQNLDSTSIDLINKIFNDKLLKCIADVKSFESELFIRFNRERTMKWLCLKFEQIKKSLAKHGFKSNTTGGFTINNYVAASNLVSTDIIDQSQYNSMALQILSDYIGDDYERELRTILGIPDIKHQQQQQQQQQQDEDIKDENNDKKRKLDSSPAKKKSKQHEQRKMNDKNKVIIANVVAVNCFKENFFFFSSFITHARSYIKSSSLEKKPKLTHTQRMLNKVDKSGIKDISSYFKKHC